MGGSSSKTVAVAPMPEGEVAKAPPGTMTQKEALEALPDSKMIFDAHCFYYNYMQQTEGFKKLEEAMAANGVGFASVCGGPRPSACNARSSASFEPVAVACTESLSALHDGAESVGRVTAPPPAGFLLAAPKRSGNMFIEGAVLTRDAVPLSVGVGAAQRDSTLNARAVARCIERSR